MYDTFVRRVVHRFVISSFVGSDEGGQWLTSRRLSCCGDGGGC